MAYTRFQQQTGANLYIVTIAYGKTKVLLKLMN